jgi:hypothetical protein
MRIKKESNMLNSLNQQASKMNNGEKKKNKVLDSIRGKTQQKYRNY